MVIVLVPISLRSHFQVRRAEDNENENKRIILYNTSTTLLGEFALARTCYITFTYYNTRAPGISTCNNCIVICGDGRARSLRHLLLLYL